jgi:hypothetical protein
MSISSETQALMLRASERALLTELGDGSAVLLDLESKFYFTLNETAIVVWRRLAQRDAPAASREDLVAAVVAEFETDAQTADADLASLLDVLTRERLVNVVRAAP